MIINKINKIYLRISIIKIILTRKILQILFLLLQISINVNSQSDKCSLVSSPKTYSDCSIYDNLPSSTICCLIRGVYGGNNGTACIPVDSLFSNKSVTLTNNGVTGTMLCGASVSSMNFIQIDLIKTLILFIIFLIL